MRLYHGSDERFSPGDVLGGATRRNYRPETYRAEGVFLTDSPGVAYFYAVFGAFSSARFDTQPRVYSVEATEATRSAIGEWTAPAAVVRADVTEEALADFRRGWERDWKPMIEDTPTTGMPTTKMILDEFERRMKTGAKEAEMTEQKPEQQKTEEPTGEMAEAVRFGIVDCSDPAKALEQLLTLDSDNDGVPNYRDKAPFDPKVSALVCSGCGERYDPDQVEGSLHDHWTAAEHTASVPGDSNVRHLFGLDTEAATFRRHKDRSETNQSPWDKKVMHAVTKDKGFTFRDVVGDGPKDGFMVSIDKSTEVKVPLRDLTPDRIADYMSVHQQALKDPNNYLGGWVYKGNVYLDISRHTSDRAEAMKLARANKQLGIYDIGKGETLMTEQEQAEMPRAAMIISSTPRDPADRKGIERFIAAMRETAAASSPSLCSDCFTEINGWEPEMGDDDSVFEPGICANCGRDMIVFTRTA